MGPEPPKFQDLLHRFRATLCPIKEKRGPKEAHDLLSSYNELVAKWGFEKGTEASRLGVLARGLLGTVA